MMTFDEGEALEVPFRFLDSGGNETTPATLEYKLRNLTEDVTEVDWTTVTPASSGTINVSALNVRIVDDRNRREVQELTLVANRGLATQKPHVITWYVKNLSAYT